MRVDMLLRIINPYTRDRRIANPSGRREGTEKPLRFDSPPSWWVLNRKVANSEI